WVCQITYRRLVCGTKRRWNAIGASFPNRSVVGTLSEPRFQIEALLELYRRLVLKSKRRWNAIGASFPNRSSVGTLSEPRSQIEAPIGPKSHPTYNHKPKNAPPTRGALN